MAQRLDRDAVDRILARAHRLDVESAESGVEPDVLIEAASEVGIDPDAVRDSLAIERFSIDTPPERRLDRFAGAAQVVVERELPLTVDEAISRLEEWLTFHRLVCDRRAEGSLVTRRRSDTSAQIGRMLSAARGDGRLVASALRAEAVPQTVGTSPTRPRALVRISADRSGPRRIRLAGGGGMAGLGVAGGAVAAAEALIAFPAVAFPLTIGGYAVARSGRGQADRLELELERLLSQVERGEQPTGFLGRVAQRARRAATNSR